MSYNFRYRFTEETVDQVFRWILKEAAEAGYLSPKTVFIEDTHIKANANTKKQVKVHTSKKKLARRKKAKRAPFTLILFGLYTTETRLMLDA